VPVRFKVIGREEDSLYDVMTTLFGADLVLTRILIGNLNLDLDEDWDVTLQVARDAMAKFARGVEKSGRWRRFYYVDPSTHKAYFNYLDEIRVADLQAGRAKSYLMDSDDYSLGLALLVLEEELSYISWLLSQRLGVEGAKEGLRRLLEELKGDPRNAVRMGFVRLTTTPPTSEEELREMLRYAEGTFQSQELREAWSEVVKAGEGWRLFLTDVLKAYLASRGTGYRLPERFRVYEHGGTVMLVGDTGWAWEVGWYRVGGDSWEELAHAELDRETLHVLEGLMVEDFRRGLPPARIAEAASIASHLSFAVYGYQRLARAVYVAARDEVAYAKVVDDSHGEDLVVHIIQNPDVRGVRGRFLFVVEHGGTRFLMDERMVLWALGHLARARLGLTEVEYGLLLDMYREEYDLDDLVGAVNEALANLRVRAKLLGDLERWLREWSPLGSGRERRGRQPVSVGG